MNEGFSVVREVGDAVTDVTSGDVLPGGSGQNSAENPLARATGGRKFLLREGLLHLPVESIPVGLAEVCEGTVGWFWEVH